MAPADARKRPFPLRRSLFTFLPSALRPNRVNVAILTHDALEYTKLCLASLAKYATEPYDVFIVDNASTDGTREWLAEQSGHNLHFHQSPVNLGVSSGRNRLIELMRPTLGGQGFVAFMDNDVEMTASWQQPFLNFFESRPEVGIAAKLGFDIIVHSASRELRSSSGQYPTPVDIVTGFAFWTRAAVIRQVGLFDEKLDPFWHEDDDYSVRAIAAGWEVFILPAAPIIHHGSKSGTSFQENALAQSLKNQRYLADKWRKMSIVDDRGRIVHPRSVRHPHLPHFPKNDAYWTQLVEEAERLIEPGDTVFAQECFIQFFAQALPYLILENELIPSVDWIILHKDYADHLGAQVMGQIKSRFEPVFANEVFVLFAGGEILKHRFIFDGKKSLQSLVFEADPVHVEALWMKVDDLTTKLPQPVLYEGNILEKISNLLGNRSSWPPVVSSSEEAGIVISACGRLFKPLYANIRNLRDQRCELPVDVWHLPGEFSDKQISLLSSMVNMVDAGETPFDGLSGRHEVHGFKAWMLSQSRFQKTLMLDVNCFPLQNLDAVFQSGRSCIMWRDTPWGCCYTSVSQLRRALNLPVHPFEFESGQLYVNKESDGVIEALRLAAALNTLGAQLYEYTYGDKETYSISFDFLHEPYAIAPAPGLHPPDFTMNSNAGLIQPWFDGSDLFFHSLGVQSCWWQFKTEWIALEKEAGEAEASCQ